MEENVKIIHYYTCDLSKPGNVQIYFCLHKGLGYQSPVDKVLYLGFNSSSIVHSHLMKKLSATDSGGLS